MADPLVQTTLRIPEQLKAAAEDAASVEDRSFSNFVCQAVAEKLARQSTVPPSLERVHSFIAQVEFDFPTRMSAHSLAQVTMAAMSNAAHDVGARNVRSRLSIVVPPM